LNVGSRSQSLSQIVLDGQMIYETVDNQRQFELNIENDEIDILIQPQRKTVKYYLYINGNEYNDIINDKETNITKWVCSYCNHSNYKHSKHCRSCRRRNQNDSNINWSNNILIPPPPPPPPPPLPTYNELIRMRNNYEMIIKQQKDEILKLKQRVNDQQKVTKTPKSDKDKNDILQCLVQTQEKILSFEKSLNNINKTRNIVDAEKKNCLKLIDHVFGKM